MPHLFQPAGDAALALAMQHHPLLAFDFDGTLAPIVAIPRHARISQSVSGKLRRLAAGLQVAIVTGRSAEDVRGRLGFEPTWIVGNHGADLRQGGAEQAADELEPIRQAIAARRGELARLGIAIEDKGVSLALHYRVSRWPQQALALIDELLRDSQGQCARFGGKMVENILPPRSPDKAAAMRHLVDQTGASCAVFVGDDVNDEPVFASAPAHWLTIRVGRDDPASRAQFFLDSIAEVGMLLDRMLVHLTPPR